MRTFEGKQALITGAGSGIGRAIARAWATAGGGGYLVGRNRERLQEVAELMRSASAPVQCLPLDLEDKVAIDSVCRTLCDEAQQLDLLVHCAGTISIGRVEEGAAEEFDRQYRVNLRAPYLLTQKLLPLLRRGRGQVVFVNSSAGLSSHAGFAQYAATKHALKALADSLRAEVNAEGIRVVSVYPGRTASPMQQALCRMEERPYRPELLLQPEDVASSVLHAIGLPPSAELTDLQIRPMQKNWH